jgi:hypothetical protein
MAPGRPPPPFLVEYPITRHTSRAQSKSASLARNRISSETLRTESRVDQ